MSYTDDDVAALAVYDCGETPPCAGCVMGARETLAVVAPQIAARALREAADDLVGQVWECDPHELGAMVVAWLRARAQGGDDQ